MTTWIGKSESEWVGLAWTWVHNEIQPGQRVFVPAGETPRAIYRSWRDSPSAILPTLRLIQLDEVISGPKQGLFRQFFLKELAPFESQIEWIDQAHESRADVAILGVGGNGHVAFHEPGIPRSFSFGKVELSYETKSQLGLNEKTWGLTYGVQAFLESKKILVLARGEKKKRIIQKALEEKNLPISWILEHPNVTLLTDFNLDY